MATIRQVERFTVTFSGVSTTKTLTTTLLDITKAFLVFGIEETSSSPQYGQVRGQITNTTTLTFTRYASDALDVVVTGYVVEFTDGVTVQRGSHTRADVSSEVTLSSLDLTKSFRICSFSIAGSAYGNDDFQRSRLYDDAGTKKLQFQSIGGSAGIVDWQVVEYDDCSVQRGLCTITTGSASITDSITSVDRNKSWLISDFETAAANPATNQIRGQINSTVQLTFDRALTDATNLMNISWEVVEFTDGTIVQEIFESFVGSDQEEDYTISEVTSLTRAFACASGQMCRGGKSDYSANDYEGNAWFTCDLTSTTNLKTRRGRGDDDADVVIYVIDFPVAVEQEGFRWRNDDGDEDEATWKAAQDTDINIAKNTTVRLRVILDSDGNPDACTYQLEWKESNDGDSEWLKVEP